jgi:hypothetical protein
MKAPCNVKYMVLIAGGYGSKPASEYVPKHPDGTYITRSMRVIDEAEMLLLASLNKLAPAARQTLCNAVVPEPKPEIMYRLH